MTDYSSIQSGATVYPLPTANGIGGVGASLLRDADPACFFLLEFFTAVLQRHIGPRLIAEAIKCGAPVSEAVADVIPFDPEPYLTERHTSFPLLSAQRRSLAYEDIGGQVHSVSSFEVVYTLPPTLAGERENLNPILKAVVDVLSNRTTQGMDPLYQPAGGTLGQSPWELSGISSAEVKGATFGSLEGSDDVFFPAVVLQVELKEKNAGYLGDFENWEGGNADLDIADPIEDTVEDVVQVYTYPAPTLTVASPNSGSKAGGTSVTLTGTNFRTGTTPRVYFGGVAATSVVVASATSVTCVTPAHTSYPSDLVDVVLTAEDGQSAELVAGFTYTTP